jgi:ribA/ribD-fused uncharacterized protein
VSTNPAFRKSTKEAKPSKTSSHARPAKRDASSDKSGSQDSTTNLPKPAPARKPIKTVSPDGSSSSRKPEGEKKKRSAPEKKQRSDFATTGDRLAGKAGSKGAATIARPARSDKLGKAMLAIENGDLDEFKRLVPKVVPVDAKSSQGHFLLEIANYHDNQAIAAYIEKQLTGRVIKAIEDGDIEEVKKFVPSQVRPDATSTSGRSLLSITFHHKHDHICEYLESPICRGRRDSSASTALSSIATSAAKVKAVRVIEFYDKHSDYYEFTNFYQGERIELDGVSWKTAEHYFQAQKFVGDFVYLKSEVWGKDTAREAYKVAASNKAYWRPDWQTVKLDVMRKVLAAKFGQDEDLRKSLCKTGNAQLVEASPNDAFWGYGPDGKGKNMLGKLLMELRTELQDEV